MADDNFSPFELPVARIDKVEIPPATLQRLPKEIASEFSAVFFKEDANELSLGVALPQLLKANAREALAVLERQVGKKIKLYKISRDDFVWALGQYGRPAGVNNAPVPSPTDKNQPPTYKSGGDVSDAMIKRVPMEYAKEHHLLAVDFLEPNIVWFATDRPEGEAAIPLQLIARRNRFEPRTIKVDEEEFLRLLNIREAVEMKLEEGGNAEDLALGPTERSDVATDEDVSSVAPQGGAKEEGTIDMPDAGTILTGEVEKKGIAGLFQRASQIFSRSEPTPTPTPTPSPITSDTPSAPPSVPNSSGQNEVKSDLAANQTTKKVDGEETPLAVPAASTVQPPVITPPTPVPASPDTKEEKPPKILKADPLFLRPVTSVEQLTNIVREGSVPRTVAGLINFAVNNKASDIHLEPYSDELLVRYRVDGQLGEVVKLPMSLHPAITSRIKILSKLKLDESRIPQDGRFDVIAAGGREIDIRVSTLPTVNGEKVVLRLLDKSEGIYTLEKLGLVGDGFNRLIVAIGRAYGVVLSTGPTGSGKTTTLYAILQRVATTNVNVITLEDPVEYEMKGINQSQIKPKIGFTFAEGLRSVLRQDPNIIMVGEVRDGETASMVTHAALTGHLVLSTLHTNDAAGALPRLINMGIEPFLITSAMDAIIGQRLVRRLCPECKEAVTLPETVRKEVDQDLEEIRRVSRTEAERIPKDIVFYRQKGCDKCTNGYRGRVGLFEVTTMTDAIEELTIKKAPSIEIKKAAVEGGMITMKQDGILKVLAGVTTLDEVLRETSSR